MTPPRIVCIPNRDATFAAEARRLAARIPADRSGPDALDWFAAELRHAFPRVIVRQQSALAQAGKGQVTWYVALAEERHRIDLDVHVPLTPPPAFEVYVGRVTEWQRTVALEPRRILPGLVGSEYDAVYRFLGRAYRGTFRIVEADPPRSISIEAAGADIVVTYTTTFGPEPGGTVVQVKGNYTLPDHVLGRIADRLGLERAITRDLQRANEAYRSLCEAVSRGPG